MSKKIILIGAGGQGKVTADLARKCGYEVIGFLDDHPPAKEVLGFPVLGKISEAEEYKNECAFIISIGSNLTRKNIAEKLTVQWATLIHPTAQIGLEVEIAEGTAVLANAVINSSAKIGKHCIINSGAVVEHDNRLEAYVHLSPHATLCGTVKIGSHTQVGAGAVIKNNTSVCGGCVIGAGAVVTKNITESGTYIGVPAGRV